MHIFPRTSVASLRSKSVGRLSAAFATLLFICTSAAAQNTPGPAELPRFSQVSERLYRGAQPRRGGLARLAQLGVNTVVNLRGADERTRADEAEAAALGLRYFNLPMPVWGRPEDGQARRVLEIIAAPESGRVFVHCKDGVDRTGTIVALYRITVEGWSADAATAEASARGMRRVQVWMRDYIDDYYERRVREAVLGSVVRADAGRDVRDRFGSYVRNGEQATFRVRKTARRVLRRAPGTVNGLLGRVF
jgi:tyrosine-protein phosphatase SIW14